MKIATKLHVTTLFSVTLILVMVAILFSANRQVREELRKNELAEQIADGVSALRYLTLEYLVRRDERVQAQWKLKHASLNKLLASTEFPETEEQAVLSRLREDYQRLQSLFSGITRSYEKQSANEARVAVQEYDERIAGQIVTRVEGMISGASRLAERSRNQVADAVGRTRAAVMGFGGILIIAIPVLLFLVTRSIARPLRRLQEGAATVGSGNLDYRLGMGEGDEIGRCAQAFDAMTEKLKSMTRSLEERTTELTKANQAAEAEIAERRRAEDTLRQSERRFRSLVTATSQIVWSTDGEGRVTGPIPNWQAYTGQTDGEIMGSGWASAVHPDDVQPTLAAWSRAVATKTPYDVEYRIRGRDGVYRHFSARGVPILDDDGAIQEWVGTCSDITERKQAEDALRESESKFKRMYDSNIIGIIFWDLAGNITQANGEFLRLVGYTDDEVLSGKARWKDMTPLEYASLDEKALKELAETGVCTPFEKEFIRKDGSRAPILLGAANLQGQKDAGICFVLDITERKRAERALSERAEELARSNQELEQFAYVASHDLQEPLRMVSSYTELLGRRYRGKLDADADEFIAFAVDGARRMQKMINDLLLYSRVGTHGKPFEPTDCGAVLDQVLRDIRVTVEESGAAVGRDPLPVIPADAVQIGQVFQNLLANAIKFRGTNQPRIHISAHLKDSAWVFSVRDNGIGIDPQFFDRLFIIFQRLHSKEHYPGTGIGLAVCKKIVERHGGRIWVESQPGKGASFFFTIPNRGGVSR